MFLKLLKRFDCWIGLHPDSEKTYWHKDRRFYIKECYDCGQTREFHYVGFWWQPVPHKWQNKPLSSYDLFKF